MTTIVDCIREKLAPVYGSNRTNADLLRAHWAANGFGQDPQWQTRYDWYKAQGALGTTLVDAELDYWLNRYGGTGGDFLVTENGDFLVTENGDFLVT